MDGIKKFALFPTKMESGEKVWLKSYWRYYNGYTTRHGETILWSTNPDRFSGIYKNFSHRDDALAYILKHGKLFK